MLLRVILMFCFEILRIFGEKSQKRKTKNLGKKGLVRCSVGNPRRGVAVLRRGEAEVQKWHPSGMPRRSSATPW